jgi:hypothetical protein
MKTTYTTEPDVVIPDHVTTSKVTLIVNMNITTEDYTDESGELQTRYTCDTIRIPWTHEDASYIEKHTVTRKGVDYTVLRMSEAGLQYLADNESKIVAFAEMCL